MNHFFALTLPAAGRSFAAHLATGWQDRLKSSGIKARWYEPDDYHITLKFLGDLPAGRRPELIAAAAPVARQAAPVTITLEGPGAFRDLRRPRVLWAGATRTPSLTALAGAVDQAMAGLGFEREGRAYQPHITLARCIPARPDPNGIPLPHDEHLFPSFVVDQFVLMQTLPPETRPNEPRGRYTIVHTFPLGTTPSPTAEGEKRGKRQSPGSRADTA